ncbi:hypothetical protein [Mycobacterium sp.]|uniref:hypothetical protein n=1 Tax=Mycobacterium sp. TaxID=1785 RepID=UPI00260F1DD7|nr:hypothetical protein [Mycobacterium sp.]
MSSQVSGLPVVGHGRGSVTVFATDADEVDDASATNDAARAGEMSSPSEHIHPGEKLTDRCGRILSLAKSSDGMPVLAQPRRSGDENLCAATGYGDGVGVGADVSGHFGDDRGNGGRLKTVLISAPSTLRFMAAPRSPG